MVEDVGLTIRFSDGYQMALHPKSKVPVVTAPSGNTCTLSSLEGEPYLAALCHDEKAAETIRKHLGRRPHQLAGRPKPPRPKAGSPRVSEVHIDTYA